MSESWVIIDFEARYGIYLLPRRARDRVQPPSGRVKQYATQGSFVDTANGYVVDTAKGGALEPSYVVAGSVIGSLLGGVISELDRTGEFEISRSGLIDKQHIKYGAVAATSRVGVVQLPARSGYIEPIQTFGFVQRAAITGGVVTNYANSGNIVRPVGDGAVLTAVSRSGIVDSLDSGGIVDELERGGAVE